MGLRIQASGLEVGVWALVATRWSATPSSKVNMLHTINARASCGANLVTFPTGSLGVEIHLTECIHSFVLESQPPHKIVN